MNVNIESSKDIQTMLCKRKEYLEKLIEDSEMRKQTYPQGTLRVSRDKNRIQYFHRQKPSDRAGKYIPKKHLEIAQQLAQKDYENRVSKVARKELEGLQRFIKTLPETDVEEVYEMMPDTRKNLIVPRIETQEMYAERWKEVAYEGKTFPDDLPELLTGRGERVRSKSEVIIANQLAQMDIPYRYEYPVRLRGLGTVYPDFTVLNVQERREVIWEHFGIMDDPDYAEKAVRKLIVYNLNGYFLGENLLATFETKTNPINIRQIQYMIDHYFNLSGEVITKQT